MTYSERLLDPRWQRRRLEIFQRDNFTCRDCGTTADTLHVHHCHYGKKEPWEVHEKFLLTLCDACHKDRQDTERELKEAMAEIAARLSVEALEALVLTAQMLITQGHADPAVMSEQSIERAGFRKLLSFAYKNRDARPVFDRMTGAQFDWASFDRVMERMPEK